MKKSQRDFEYLIGVIQGDGNVRKSRNEVRIFISEKETEFINIIREMAIKTFGISPRIYYQKNNSLIVLNFKSKELTYLISQYKDSTTGLWSIPKKLNHPEEWLAGIWDTDGYAKFEDGKLECIFTQKSNGNVKFVESALKEIGIARYYVSTFEDYRWQELTETDYLRIWSTDTEIFANKINLRFPKKRRALEEALAHNKFSACRPVG
ncbi:MAG: LAGLIDADG family homing endonuclease, partial [Halanaerobiales bacterium]